MLVSAILLHLPFQPLYFCCETSLPAPLAFTGPKARSEEGAVTFMPFWLADYTSDFSHPGMCMSSSYYGKKTIVKEVTWHEAFTACE